jgi:hypothetical protein
MDRRQKRAVRGALGQSVSIPLTVAFWSLWAMAILCGLRYLGVF